MNLKRRQLLGLTILFAVPFLGTSGLFEKLKRRAHAEILTTPIVQFQVVYTFENEDQYRLYTNAVDFSNYKSLVEEFRADGRIMDFKSVTTSDMSCATYTFRDRAALDSYLVVARSWASGQARIRKQHQVAVKSYIS